MSYFSSIAEQVLWSLRCQVTSASTVEAASMPGVWSASFLHTSSRPDVNAVPCRFTLLNRALGVQGTKEDPGSASSPLEAGTWRHDQSPIARPILGMFWRAVLLLQMLARCRGNGWRGGDAAEVHASEVWRLPFLI
jgi:hypothetical protein